MGWKSERKLTDQDFLFGRLTGAKTVSVLTTRSFRRRVGYGRRLIDNDKHKLNAELGAGARQSELQDGIEETRRSSRGGCTTSGSSARRQSFART